MPRISSSNPFWFRRLALTWRMRRFGMICYHLKLYFIGDTKLELSIPLLFWDACILLIQGYIFIFGSSSISLSSSDPLSGRTPTLAAATWWSRGWWVSCGLGRTEWGGSALGWYELRPFRSSWWLKSAMRRGSVETSGTVLFNTYELIQKLNENLQTNLPKFPWIFGNSSLIPLWNFRIISCKTWVDTLMVKLTILMIWWPWRSWDILIWVIPIHCITFPKVQIRIQFYDMLHFRWWNIKRIEAIFPQW